MSGGLLRVMYFRNPVQYLDKNGTFLIHETVTGNPYPVTKHFITI